MAAGWFNCRHFLDEFFVYCSPRGLLTPGKTANAVVHRNRFLVCIFEARENLLSRPDKAGADQQIALRSLIGDCQARNRPASGSQGAFTFDPRR